MGTRREFVRIAAGTAAGGLAEVGWVRSARAGALLERLRQPHDTLEVAARDEDYWSAVGSAFTVDRGLVNLNNGGVSPSPWLVQEAVRRHLEAANAGPTAQVLFGSQRAQREPVRLRLAREWGVDAEEMAITRNSSESLQICQQGAALKAGDEVLTTTHDYPRMVTTFRQRERREGIVLRQVRLPVPCEDDEEVVRLFEAGMSSRTRLVLMCHVVNITGQVLPVRRVVEMARGRGVPVIVDGAHALAHIDFRLPELGCDYYGTSLHKWLCAPTGTGLLYVRRERIGGLWPLMAAEASQDGDIRKFEETGTRPEAGALGIAEALTLHQAIGGKRKESRLRYLRDRWARRLLGHASGRVRLHTSLHPSRSCAIGTFEVEGIESGKLAAWLLERQGIVTTAISHAEFSGIRVTPNVYTTLEEVDRFAEAVERGMDRGVE